MLKRQIGEKLFKLVLFLCALISIFSVFLIALFILIRGIPAIGEIGPAEFLFGMVWNPSADEYGIFPMIVGSLYITGGALIIGVPVGVLTAIYLARFCSPWLYRFLKPMIELLAGNSLLAAIIILGIMVLPTIIAISESALRSVPESYYEGSLALGATREETVFGVVVPAAKSGILTAVILGIGRAIGETMAVILVAGNSTVLPESITSSVRSMTANIAMEMSYASGLHQGALFGTGAVLLVFVILLITILNVITSRAGDYK